MDWIKRGHTPLGAGCGSALSVGDDPPFRGWEWPRCAFVDEFDFDADREPDLLRIGQLAREAGETNATLRYWTKEGLLQVAETTDSGYQLYHPNMIQSVHRIRELQGQRLKLSEIRGRL